MPPSSSEEPAHLFYLIRKGTNARVLNKDDIPILVEGYAVQDELDHYNRIFHYQVVGISVREWHERYWIPVLTAKNAVYDEAFPKPNVEVV